MKIPNRQKLAAWTDNDQEIIRFVEKLAANECCADGASGGSFVLDDGTAAADGSFLMDDGGA